MTSPARWRWPGWPGAEGRAAGLTEERLRAEGGVLDGVSLIGTGCLVDRMWTKPAISVLGIDAPPIGGAPPTPWSPWPGEDRDPDRTGR